MLKGVNPLNTSLALVVEKVKFANVRGEFIKAGLSPFRVNVITPISVVSFQLTLDSTIRVIGELSMPVSNSLAFVNDGSVSVELLDSMKAWSTVVEY